RGRAAGPDGLTPELLKEGGPVLAARLTEILARIWELDVIPTDCEDADKMQIFLTTLNLNVSMFGMRFSPSKCKMLLQDWLNSAPKLVIGGETIECVNRFTYLGSLISPNGLVSDEILARIHEARSAFANLRHLWRRRDIRLMTKGRALHSNTTSRMRAYGELSSELVISSGVRQG
ncbi:polyprotein, partial [Schistosoma japonicum]